MEIKKQITDIEKRLKLVEELIGRIKKTELELSLIKHSLSHDISWKQNIKNK